ncbi:MAG: hypothetical protein L0177_17445 [Chloroflexi bacterium]|nr:hypothetical protein [Chloroflexota bacterium]
MTQRYILDENVVILAQRGQNERGEQDYACRELITRIIRICHSIVFDPILREKYLRQVNRIRTGETQDDFRVLSTIVNASRVEGKVIMRPVALPFPEETAIPQGSQDDRYIVRLAVETRAILVTTDAALKDDLNSCGVQEAYSLQLLSPDEALKVL